MMTNGILYADVDSDAGRFTYAMINAAAKMIYAQKHANEPHWRSWDDLENSERRSLRQCALAALKAAEAEM